MPVVEIQQQQCLRNSWRSMLLRLPPGLIVKSFTCLCRARKTTFRSAAKVGTFATCTQTGQQQQYLRNFGRSMLLRLLPWVDCQISHVPLYQPNHSRAGDVPGKPRTGQRQRWVHLPRVPSYWSAAKVGTFATCTQTGQQQQYLRNLWRSMLLR